MKDTNVKKTVSLSEEEMKKVLGGDAQYSLGCQQLPGGKDCGGECAPIYDNGKLISQKCKKIREMDFGYVLCGCGNY